MLAQPLLSYNPKTPTYGSGVSVPTAFISNQEEFVVQWYGEAQFRVRPIAPGLQFRFRIHLPHDCPLSPLGVERFYIPFLGIAEELPVSDTAELKKLISAAAHGRREKFIGLVWDPGPGTGGRWQYIGFFQLAFLMDDTCGPIDPVPFCDRVTCKGLLEEVQKTSQFRSWRRQSA